ncbi:MAG: hypothetical protein PVJ80_02635 [Gemmatimonadota bacterium]
MSVGDRIRRHGSRRLCLALLVAGTAWMAPRGVSAQAPAGWEVPRTPYGHPDLQGNWQNATITPIQRPQGQGRVLTPPQVADIEGGREEFVEEQVQASDPDREAPPSGGVLYGDPLLDAASGGTGGYNYFWIDAGNKVAVYNGEPRSSLITNPDNGRVPPMTPEGQQAARERMLAARQFGEFDNPENRPLSDRCIMSFGSNAGPPMLPNYFYNNNYTIVQTPDYVMIMTEMIHDVRIIPLGDNYHPLPDYIRPWMGDSHGHWEGDTLVIETTNIRPEQVHEQSYAFPGGSVDLKVEERLTRAGPDVINYEFTVIDPETYTQPWGGQVPFRRQPGLIYEYACHEGNYAMTNMLRGARAEEREQAEKN